MKFDETKDYNLARIEKVLDDGIILKPISVVDGTGYKKFKVELSKREINILVEENNDDLILLPYKDKKLIEFE
ncbi:MULTISPECIES: hypothetical protein [Clostridium]|uniref:hypothetical protein n=1 Tax=Clostridium TaxID=1485 RepID=UPI00232B650E|nr:MULTISPECIES: hypothetical protein [Clostridium]MDB2104842.1 hypothetical protein [Clostridium paraputrificum]MDU2108692.1 hypothetical protein [Clostridium sp.]MDU3355197.1 hypothetical protein [Clostridium sp.]MDU4727945.1 hypothetical protein [Clostridium sp.]